MKKYLISIALVAGLALVGIGLASAVTDRVTDTDKSYGFKKGMRGWDSEQIQEMVQQSLADGKITQEEADKKMEMIEEKGQKYDEMMQNQAEMLGISVDELKTELKDGKSIAKIAEEQGVSIDEFWAQMLEYQKSQIEQAVADGKITQEQADEKVEMMQNMQEKDGFGGPGMFKGMRRGFGKGFGWKM